METKRWTDRQTNWLTDTAKQYARDLFSRRSIKMHCAVAVIHRLLTVRVDSASDTLLTGSSICRKNKCLRGMERYFVLDFKVGVMYYFRVTNLTYSYLWKCDIIIVFL